jgi:hypothetical protein
VTTINQNPEPELLWWVGCAPATDARAQKTARAFAQLLAAAGANYAILGQNEQCSGDSARRAGNEFLFNERPGNVELLNEVAPRRPAPPARCLHSKTNIRHLAVILKLSIILNLLMNGSEPAPSS